MKKERIYISSENKQNKLRLSIWRPEGEVLALLQISHGMIEHMDRYEELAEYLCGRGFVVAGADHIGHGGSVRDTSEYGYFTPAKGKNGAETVLADLRRVMKRLKKEYPSIPYFLLGHSMGSFYARAFIAAYGSELSGAIIMGTGAAPLPVLMAGKALVRFLVRLKGAGYHSAFLGNTLNKVNNLGIKHPCTPSDWLTHDSSRINAYISDPMCRFNFSLNGYEALLDILSMDEQAEHLTARGLAELPIHFMSGAEDPVGKNGKAVKKLYARYIKKGYKRVSMKLYEHDRHEILNELDREQVLADIAEYLMGLIETKA